MKLLHVFLSLILATGLFGSSRSETVKHDSLAVGNPSNLKDNCCFDTPPEIAKPGSCPTGPVPDIACLHCLPDPPCITDIDCPNDEKCCCYIPTCGPACRNATITIEYK